MTVNFTTCSLDRIKPIKDSPKATPNIASLRQDSFEPKIIEAKNGDYKVKCKPVKNVYLKDADGNDISALLARNIHTKDQYFILKDDETLCRIYFSDNKTNMYVYDLQGHNHKGKYKGAGKELIKLAVKESIKNGYNGKLSVCMAGSLPFYYKCNFRIPDNVQSATKKNAFVDYMTRHPEFNSDDFMKNGWIMPNGECLDEKGAAALLEDKRFIDNSTSKTMYSTILENSNGDKIPVDIDFCDFSHDPSLNCKKSNGNYVIQIINKDRENTKTIPQIAHLEYDINFDNDEKTIEILDMDINAYDEKLIEDIKEELLKALEIKVKD